MFSNRLTRYLFLEDLKFICFTFEGSFVLKYDLHVVL